MTAEQIATEVKVRGNYVLPYAGNVKNIDLANQLRDLGFTVTYSRGDGGKWMVT